MRNDIIVKSGLGKMGSRDYCGTDPNFTSRD
jgi:hypothetical protein